MGNNIIFLDIDGVLNSFSVNENGNMELSDGALIDASKVELLSLLVRRTEAKLVLHSGWRFWFDGKMLPSNNEAKGLVEALEKRNMSLFDVTPDLTNEEIRTKRKFSLVKGKEIILWLKENPDVQNWVVLDDLDLHNDEVARHQVRTDPFCGLTPQDIADAEKVLIGMEKVQ